MFGLATILFVDTQSLKAGRYDETLIEGKLNRTYVLRVPGKADGKSKLPLVIVLHDWTGSAKGAETYTRMSTESSKGGFVAAFPEGADHGWNAGFKNLGADGADDVIFIDHVISDVAKRTPVDPKRIYIVGHGNGGMMAYLAASRLSPRIAALAVVGGTPGFDRGTDRGRVPTPTSPVSAIIIHGKLDPNVPYDHGKGLPGGKALFPDSISPLDAATEWSLGDGIVELPKKLDAQNPNLEIVDWHHGGLEVEFMTILNGNHTWPGGVGVEGPETRTGIDAADVIWRFLVAHPKS